MLALFKGELSYNEFMREMTYKDMLALRDARIKQILDEKKQQDELAEKRSRENARKAILAN